MYFVILLWIRSMFSKTNMLVLLKKWYENVTKNEKGKRKWLLKFKRYSSIFEQ